MGRALRSPVSSLGRGALWRGPPWLTGMRARSVPWPWPNWASAIAAIASPTPTPRPPWPARCGRYGQLTPLVVCLREETFEVLDGFKRLAAARTLGLADRQHAAPGGRRAHGQGGHLRPQPDRPADPGVGRSLDRSRPGPRGRPDAGRGRRAAGPAQELGLPAAGPGREAGRRRPGGPPAGAAVRPPPHGRWCGCRPATRPRCWRRFHRDELTAAELDGVVDLLAAAPARSQQEYILAQPRQALQQARARDRLGLGPAAQPGRQPRGAAPGRRAGGPGPAGDWLRSQGRAGLTPCDRLVLTPAFARLARDAHSVAALADDLTRGVARP